nr:PREDICTED: fibrinogen-like protein A [Opisthocomus hoazin]
MKSNRHPITTVPAARRSNLLFFASVLALLAPLLAVDIENLERLKANLDDIANLHSGWPKDCSEVPRGSPSGIYVIQPAGLNPIVVYCEMNVTDGGWMVIQRNRQSTEITWAESWSTYKNGWPKDCSEVPRGSPSGVYVIQPAGLHPIVVYCEMNVTDGGWTVIQRNRQSTEITWAESWSTYKNGFGNVRTEYWLGTEYIHQISKQKVYQARFVIWDASNRIKFADYNLFGVENESQGYRLRLGTYSGLAGDAMTSNRASTVHDNMKFSAKDQDQDTSSSNCASSYGGAWWYSACYSARLNVKGAITWGSLCSGNCKASAILIKPASYC